MEDRDNKDLARVLEEDLYNELRWMLCSAATWTTCGNINVPHLKVYSMDSCFLHARTLYEFLKKRKKKYPNWSDYSSKSLIADWPKLYKQAINTRLMHLVRNRSDEPQIKDEVVNVAKATLQMWDEFWAEDQIDKRYARIAKRIRDDCVNQASAIAKKSGLRF